MVVYVGVVPKEAEVLFARFQREVQQSVVDRRCVFLTAVQSHINTPSHI